MRHSTTGAHCDASHVAIRTAVGSSSATEAAIQAAQRAPWPSTWSPSMRAAERSSVVHADSGGRVTVIPAVTFTHDAQRMDALSRSATMAWADAVLATGPRRAVATPSMARSIAGRCDEREGDGCGSATEARGSPMPEARPPSRRAPLHATSARRDRCRSARCGRSGRPRRDRFRRAATPLAGARGGRRRRRPRGRGRDRWRRRRAPPSLRGRARAPARRGRLRRDRWRRRLRRRWWAERA